MHSRFLGRVLGSMFFLFLVAVPAFAAPPVGTQGTDGVISGDPWIVCRADDQTAWVAANSGGEYNGVVACQSLGYAGVDVWGGTCGTVCGYCGQQGVEIYDGQGATDPTFISVTVNWRCTQFSAASCHGVAATIAGTEGNDVIDGTDGPDVIAGLGGNDTIRGLHGDDIICGDAGHDVISGGPGSDLILGGDGGDSIAGQGGNDVISGGEGDDLLHGGKGHDNISGDHGDDRIDGGGSTDECDGGPGSNRITNCP